MYSKLPVIYDEQSIKQYNKIHSDEHAEMASWINALTKVHNIPEQISFYQLPVLNPKNIESIMNFFEVNWKQHQLFYDFANLIGQKLTIPVFVFPKNYPSWNYDLDLESFFKLEKDIHNMIWRAIDVLKSSV